MKKKTMALFAACLLSGFVLSPAIADVVKVPVGQQATDKQSLQRPQRGITKARVEALFGAPVSTSGPVGDPPISSWEYQDYVVYFEYDLVLHTVLKGGQLPD